jgi:hypothetical protein
MKKQALLSAIVVLILGSIGCGEEGGSSGTGQIRFICDDWIHGDTISFNDRIQIPCEILSPENLRQTIPAGEERILGPLQPGTYRLNLGGYTVDVCAGQTTVVSAANDSFLDNFPCPFT